MSLICFFHVKHYLKTMSKSRKSLFWSKSHCSDSVLGLRGLSSYFLLISQEHTTPIFEGDEGDWQGWETFLAIFSDKQMGNCDAGCSRHHPTQLTKDTGIEQ